MTSETTKIINEIKPKLHQIVPSGSKVMLFGSRARGDEHKGSDFDILVLLNNEGHTTEQNHDEVVFPMYMVLWEHNLDANVLLYTKSEWEAKRGKSLLYHNVMEEAIEL